MPKQLLTVLWLFFLGSREENALGCQLEWHVLITLINHKCQPDASYLEQAINVLTWLMLEEEHSGIVYQMWMQVLRTGVLGLFAICHNVEITFGQFVLVSGDLGSQLNLLNSHSQIDPNVETSVRPRVTMMHSMGKHCKNCECCPVSLLIPW